MISSKVSPQVSLTYRFDPHVRQVLNRLPATVVSKLSEEELLALYQSIAGLKAQSRQKGTTKPRRWSRVTMSLAVGTSLVIGLAAYGLSTHVQPVQSVTLAEEPVDYYPTALPWIEDEAGCKGKSRQWKDNLCYETDHDPSF